jgi:hypothetical protein
VTDVMGSGDWPISRGRALRGCARNAANQWRRASSGSARGCIWIIEPDDDAPQSGSESEQTSMEGTFPILFFPMLNASASGHHTVRDQSMPPCRNHMTHTVAVEGYSMLDGNTDIETN